MTFQYFYIHLIVTFQYFFVCKTMTFQYLFKSLLICIIELMSIITKFKSKLSMDYAYNN